MARSFVVSAAAVSALGCGTHTVVAVTRAGESATNQPPPPPDASASSNPPPRPSDAAAPFAGTGPLHTVGSRIVDDNGEAVHLAGVSWFGLETPDYAPHGLWIRTMDSLLEQIVAFGFNTLRVPFSTQLFDQGSAPGMNIAYENPDLFGLSGSEVLDQLVKRATRDGLRIVLDRHDIAAGQSSALWYNDAYDEARWISDWQMLAARYADNPAVIGFELHNDLADPATWGDGNPKTDWRAAAERAGNAILQTNSNLLIIVEGIETYDMKAYWWGGNLMGAASSPVALNLPGHVVYATQDFASDVTDQGVAHPWFQDPTYPKNLNALWDSTWGYLAEENQAPVFLTAFGTANSNASDSAWFSTIVGYVANHDLNFAYWCLNADSGDTGGLLDDSTWSVAQTDKLSVLAPLLVRHPILPPIDAGH